MRILLVIGKTWKALEAFLHQLPSWFKLYDELFQNSLTVGAHWFGLYQSLPLLASYFKTDIRSVNNLFEFKNSLTKATMFKPKSMQNPLFLLDYKAIGD
jgi:hypothetical protein